MIEAGAAFLAWSGASLVVLSDGRRGLAAGVVVSALGLAVLVLQHAGPLEAGALVLGGAAAAACRFVRGAPGWGIMPAGSTPRFVLCVAVALVGIWLALLVMNGTGAAFRFAILVVVGLAGARVLSSTEPDVVMTSVGVLALGVAAAAGLGDAAAGAVPYVVAALVAVGACVVPIGATDAA